MDFETGLLNAMHDAHVHIDGQIDWSFRDFQRFRVKNHWRRGKPLFVCLHGEGATFGDWRDPSTWRTWWHRSWQEITYAEKQKRLKELERLEHEKRLRRSHAIWRAKEMLNHRTWRGPTCVDASEKHPYVIKKKILPHYALQIRSYLVLPIFDLDGALISLQYIKPNGDKRFKKNASPKKGYVLLADVIARDTDTLWICEGWATGCSIYDATNGPVICALSASNLEEVVYGFRIKYPGNNIIVCADNDSHLPKNIGVEMARKAAKNGGAGIRIPNIKGDWNDLAIEAGIGEVKKQLLNL